MLCPVKRPAYLDAERQIAEEAGLLSTVMPHGIIHVCVQVRGNVCRALPVYLPVYLFPALLVHRKRLLDPKLAPDIGRRAALGAMRSSLFLSLYCTLAWRGACVGFQHSSESNLLCMACMLCLPESYCSNQAKLLCNNLRGRQPKALQNVMQIHLLTMMP